MWDGVISGMRLGRAIGLALPLGLFVLYWQLYGDPGAVVNQTTTQGVILEVHPSAYLVELSEPKAQVRVLRTEKMELGATVILMVTEHASGVVRYALYNPTGGH